MDISDQEVEEIITICQSYEDGFSAGRMNISADNNPFFTKDKRYISWMLGHNIGIQVELLQMEEGYIN